jgi:hypothetical protein
VRFTRPGSVRLAWGNPAGGTLYSREVGVTIG